jgi:uncharacterized protein YcaQ
VLHVGAAFLEPAADEAVIAAALAAELRELAAWLALDGVRVGRRGNLARALRAEAAELGTPRRRSTKR